MRSQTQGVLMSVVVVAVTPGMTAEHYDAANLQPQGAALPDGCTAHIAGPVSVGWRVISVWDTEEQASAYGRTVVGPAIAAQGLTPTPPAVQPAHTVSFA